jgi:hypothetical protein
MSLEKGRVIMSKTVLFTGSAVAIITPFKNDVIDFDKLEELIEFQISNGSDAIVICGTTGEVSTLPDQEHVAAVKFTVEKVGHRVPVIAGAGSNHTQHGIELSQAVGNQEDNGKKMKQGGKSQSTNLSESSWYGMKIIGPIKFNILAGVHGIKTGNPTSYRHTQKQGLPVQSTAYSNPGSNGAAADGNPQYEMTPPGKAFGIRIAPEYYYR